MSARKLGTAGSGLQAGEKWMATVPPRLQAGSPLVVVCHGALANGHSFGAVGQRRDLDLLAATGLVVVAADLGGDTAGNDTNLSRLAEIVNWAKRNYSVDTSRVVLVADSLGAMGALGWAWRNTVQFAGASLRVPVVCADLIHDRDPGGVGALIDTAYGGGAAWDTAKAGRDPLANASLIEAFADDVRIWYSTDDPTVIPSDITTFTAASGVRAVPLGAVQHVEASIRAAIPAHEQARWIWGRLRAHETSTHFQAQAEQDRWLDWIRDPTPATGYRGGDVTDKVELPDGRCVWIGADWFDTGGAALDPDDTYPAGGALPQRNGLIIEENGEFTGQVFASGSSGAWLIPNQGEHPGRHYWPICATVESGVLRVGCWLVNGALGTYGQLEDSHIVSVSLTDLKTVTGVAKMTVGSAATFYVDGFLTPGDGWTYIYGEEFLPDYGDFSPAYGDNLDTDVTRKRIARCTEGTLTTLAGWTFWNGSAWVSGVANAATLKDDQGAPIEGDAGVCATPGGYTLAAHQLVDDHLRVYRAERPQGPWTEGDPVPVPDMGRTWYGGRRVGQLTKLLPGGSAPAGHVLALMSANLLESAAALGIRDVRTVSPRVEAIPAS